MTWLIVALLAVAAVVIALGHLRLLHRQADVEATRRQIEALVGQAQALPAGAARSRLEARLASVIELHQRELARYRATPGARINRWKPRALPPKPG
jgi:hypothetical protein